MAKRFTEELYLDTGGRQYHPVDGEPNKRLVLSGKHFSFELYRKSAQFGGVPIDQWWMALPSVYGQRKRVARNLDVIIGYYWSLCTKHLTIFDDDVQDSYILARLLPYSRSNGSRRVFADAVLTQPQHVQVNKQDLIRELNAKVDRSRTQEIDLIGFRNETADALGPPDYGPEVGDKYWQMEDELLGEGRQAFEQQGEPGLQTILDRWQKWMKSIGRHGGNLVEKQILDILSYECRAALHRCYSATWYDLLPHLANKYQMNEESVFFHRLWHLDQCMDSDNSRARFHLFHGHVFALHPGTGLFMQTQTGTELMGNVLREPSDVHAYQRLLYGLLVAMQDYAMRDGTYELLRKRESCLETYGDMESIHAAQVSQSNRRRGHSSHDR